MLDEQTLASSCRYSDAKSSHAHAAVLLTVKSELAALHHNSGDHAKLVDLGCGNGSVAVQVEAEGWSVVGVDSSAHRSRIPGQTLPSSRERLSVGEVDGSNSEEALAMMLSSI